MVLLSIKMLPLIGSCPLNVIHFVLCIDIIKPYSAIICFNLCAAFRRLSSVLDIMTCSSANNTVSSCLFLESGIPAKTYFCNLVINSSKYILNRVGGRG
jgi:hypothetical protein